MATTTHASNAVGLLERDLRQIFGGRLQSLVTYGAAAETPHGHVGEHHHHHHDPPPVRAMAIADTLTADDLHACARRASGWHAAGLATPLLLAAHEFEDSLDAFPLEFGAIIADHVVVAGANPFERAKVDTADLRRACEVQVRSHLLHLRQGYVDANDNKDALAVLIVDSAPAYAGLLTTVARLQGSAVADASGVAKLAHVKEISGEEAIRIFPAYLDAVERLAKLVDAWGAR